jgi:hypothetical protein
VSFQRTTNTFRFVSAGGGVVLASLLLFAIDSSKLFPVATWFCILSWMFGLTSFALDVAYLKLTRNIAALSFDLGAAVCVLEGIYCVFLVTVFWASRKFALKMTSATKGEQERLVKNNIVAVNDATTANSKPTSF